jgi:hypothetical protein
MFRERIEDDSEETHASCFEKFEAVFDCSLASVLIILLAAFQAHSATCSCDGTHSKRLPLNSGWRAKGLKWDVYITWFLLSSCQPVYADSVSPMLTDTNRAENTPIT